ncbi:hypothetical protein KUTeg_023354 [Tegillarca granosa]|uniref:Voltage-gated hydrogen channel 1 n=1 Tax=Tegillarca granosa TaxID=220873 RepID=A0ABQ9E4W3_TEGGR|nr:hypothetical protein KUTeg_023354 [Tegillarca granosa]
MTYVKTSWREAFIYKNSYADYSNSTLARLYVNSQRTYPGNKIRGGKRIEKRALALRYSANYRNDINRFYRNASIHWSSFAYANYSQSADIPVDGVLINSTVFFGDSIKTTPKFVSRDEYKTEHITEEIVAHGFHKASVAILSILVLETCVRIFCLGRRILEKKIEVVFAAFVICISFILDIAFIKGLTMFKVQEYVFILATLIPWRVVRLVNSLIVAVLGQQHLQLKMVYTQKTEINNQLKKEKKEFKKLQRSVETLLALIQATKKRSLLRKLSIQHGVMVNAPSSIKEESEIDLKLEANNREGNNKKSLFANKFTKSKRLSDFLDDQSETSSAGSSMSDLEQRIPFLNGKIN